MKSFSFRDANNLRVAELALAKRVQSMAPIKRALLAREALISGAGSRLAYGPAEARLRALLSRTGSIGLWVTSAALLIARVRRGRRASKPFTGHGDLVFVGIGALREQQLRTELEFQSGHSAIFVDQRSPEGFGKLPTPPLKRTVHHWIRIVIEARALVARPDATFSKIDLTASIAIRAHELAWLIAMFEKLREDRPNVRVVCSTADLPAHAASIAGCSPEYYQHGLLSSALVFPEFKAMTPVTDYEGRYVASCVPGMILQSPSRPSQYAPVDRIAAIVGDYGATDAEPVLLFVNLVIAAGYRVVIRPHPRGNEGIWYAVRNLEEVTFDTRGIFDDFLKKWRPGIVASWYSTTLVDGLMAGALPVLLAQEYQSTVLPLEEIACCFPAHLDRIHKCLQSDSARIQAVDTIKALLE